MRFMGIVLGGLALVLTGISQAQTNTFPTSGNVGIGTTSPYAPLHVDSSSGTPAVSGSASGQLFLTNNGTYATVLGSKDGGSNEYSWIQGQYRDNAAATKPLILQPVGNSVGIGTTSPSYTLDVAGAIHSSGAMIATGGITFQDGTTQTTAFNPTLCGGDYAESVDVSGNRTKYEPGDVLVIDPNAPGKFLKSAEPYSTSVTGIYSTKPGTVGRRQTTPKSADEVPMAMIGIVPTKVSAENGPIKPGDLLVTSSTVGYAMKGTDRSRMLGAVIGKALGALDSGTGVIEAVVTLQ